MSEDNSVNTFNLKNSNNSKHESSDADDLDERPTEVLRNILSDNSISPTNTPAKGQSSAAGKSSSSNTNHAATGHQQQSVFSSVEDQTFNAASSHESQSTFSSRADQTYANSQAVENISEQIVDGNTTDSRTFETRSSKEASSMKETKIFDSNEPPANTAVEVLVQSNTSDPNGSPLISFSCTELEEDISLNTEQNYQPVGFAANVSMLSGSSQKRVLSSEPGNSLMTCSAEKNASTKRLKITEISEPSSSTAVEINFPSIASDAKEGPLVFVSRPEYGEEILSSPEQNNQLGTIAADVLLSDSSSKQVPSSAESDDSDDVGMYEFPSEPSQQFTTPEALGEEIRSVFEMISSYVTTEMNKTRTRRETLRISLRSRRAFIRHPLGHSLGQFSPVSRRIASELLSTLTDQEGLEFTYQGPSQINDQPLLYLIQDSAQYFGRESYGIPSQGSYWDCFQQSFAPQEPIEQLVQASGRATQESFTLDSSSSGASLDLTSQRLAPSSSRRFVQSSSEGRTLSSSGGLAEASSMEVGNSDISRRSNEFHELPPVSRLFNRGHAMGMEIGSESYAQRVSGRALQSRLGQMIEDLEQHPQVQTQGPFPQELIDLASRMVYLLSPRTTHVLTTRSPRNVSQVYFAGLFVGFSQAYSQWSSRSQIFDVCRRLGDRLLHGMSPDLERGFPLVTQIALQGSLNGPRQEFPPSSSRDFSDASPRSSRDHTLGAHGVSTSRPFGGSFRAHGSEPSSTPRSAGPSGQEGPSDMQVSIHVLLTRLVVDLSMIRYLADQILSEYRSRNFERISSYLLCFEIMREDYRVKESRYADLEQEISGHVRRRRPEAFAVLHISILMDILDVCISRVQYGALLLRMHERLDEVRTMSNSIRRVTGTAMRYQMWTKED